MHPNKAIRQENERNKKIDASTMSGNSQTQTESRQQPKVRLVTMSDVKRRAVEWLWPNRFAIGKLSLISGNPGLGKSTLSLEMATHVSRGTHWPVDGGNAPQGDTLILSAEDDIADTILPRLEAMKADVTRIHALTMIDYVNEDGGTSQRMFSLEKDIGLLDKQLVELPECRLVIIDPISAYMGHVDSHKNSDVRGLLAPLAELAQRARVAVIGVTHLNKGSSKAIYRTMGSLAFVAAARAVWGIVEDEDRPGRVLMLPVKNNIAPKGDGLAYQILSHELGGSYLEWEPESVEASMDETLYQDGERSAVDEAADWLEDVLAYGRVATTDLQRLAKQAGHSWATVRRAKNKIRAEHEQEGFGKDIKHYWRSIDAQPHTHTVSAYAERPTDSGFQPIANSENPHRCSTLNSKGDERLSDGETPTERF